jgi:hypothetical protein
VGGVRARRRPVLDRVDRDGEAAVLVDRRVVRLSPLAVALVDACPDWVPDDELAAVLVARFGQPQDAGSALESTRAALRDLAAQGLVDLG